MSVAALTRLELLVSAAALTRLLHNTTFLFTFLHYYITTLLRYYVTRALLHSYSMHVHARQDGGVVFALSRVFALSLVFGNACPLLRLAWLAPL